MDKLISVLAVEMLINILIIGAISGLGALVGRSILRSADRLEIASLAFPLGAGFLTYTLFLISWMGVRLSVLSILVTYAALIGIALIALLGWRGHAKGGRSGTGQTNAKPRIRIVTPAQLVAISIMAGLLAFSIFIGVGRSHANWDTAAMWVIKGYGISLEGSIFAGERWGAARLAYPLNIHLLVSIFRFMSEDSLPGSKLIYVAFFASSMLGCYAYWLRRHVDPWLATGGLLLVATVPVIYSFSTIGFANLPMASYVLLGSIWAVEGIFRPDKRAQLVSGILLGLATWTIIEGILYSVVAVAAVLLVWRLVRVGRPDVAWWILPMALISGIWLAFYGLYGARGSQAMGTVGIMLESMQRGDFNLVELRLIFGYIRRYLFRTERWGLLFPVGLLFLIIGRRIWFSRESPEVTGLLAVTASTGFLTAILFYLRSFVGLDIYSWLQRGFPRAFLLTAMLFGLLAILVAAKALAEDDRLGVRLARHSRGELS